MSTKIAEFAAMVDTELAEQSVTRARAEEVKKLIHHTLRRADLTDAEAGRQIREQVEARVRWLHAAKRVDILEGVHSVYGWNRAYIVPGGHVHSGRECSSLRFDTKIVLLPECSGMSEDEIVELAGERACTLCYPSAPVDVLKRKTRLFTQDEREAEEAKERARREREVKASGKEAAKITVVLPSRSRKAIPTETFGTVRAARIEAVDLIVRALYGRIITGNNEFAGTLMRDADAIVTALTVREGVSGEKLKGELVAKASTKFAKSLTTPVPSSGYAGITRDEAKARIAEALEALKAS